MSMPFLRDKTLKFCTRVLMCPRQAFYDWGFLFLFFFRWKFGIPYDPNIRRKYPNPKMSGGKKNHLKKARQGHIKHVCKISGVYLSKTAWTLDSEEI